MTLLCPDTSQVDSATQRHTAGGGGGEMTVATSATTASSTAGGGNARHTLDSDPKRAKSNWPEATRKGFLQPLPPLPLTSSFNYRLLIRSPGIQSPSPTDLSPLTPCVCRITEERRGLGKTM